MITSRTGLSRTVFLAGCLAGTAGMAVAAPDTGPVAVFRALLDDFNRGDLAAAQATLAPQLSIIDDFPPFEWHGADAFATWGSDYQKAIKAEGLSTGKLKILSVVRSQVDGENAYVVYKAVLTFRQHGRPMAMPGREAVSLHKGADGWKITGMGWAGDVAHPVAANAKAPALAN